MTSPPPSPTPENSWREHPQISRWVQAGLLDPTTADRLYAFERDRAERRSYRGPALGIALLGALAVITGIGTLIAYNWALIPQLIKLGAMLLLLLLSGGAAYVFHAREGEASEPRLDIAVLLHTGFSLASLALVSQIYHQDGELWVLLAIWSLLTAPALYATKSRFTQNIWFASLWITLVSSFDAAEGVIERLPLFQHASEFTVVVTFGLLGAGLAAIWMKSPLAARRRVGADLFRAHFWVLGLFGSFIWFSTHQAAPGLLGLGLLSFGALAWLSRHQAKALGFSSPIAIQSLLGLGLLTMLVPVGFGLAENGFLAFLGFIAFWGLVWHFAEEAKNERWVRAAMSLLALRIVAASFELFESMWITGLVLAGLGVLALVLTQGRLRQEKREENHS